jgi:hypothetical protein
MDAVHADGMNNRSYKYQLNCYHQFFIFLKAVNLKSNIQRLIFALSMYQL